ncbi:MAG TPA: sarcosine oxidase subunit gamma family protein [Hyphomicrobiaceae bacterium]|jgi:sarcosine oxidase subunit gamma
MPEPRSFAIRRMALAKDDRGSDPSARDGAVVIRLLPPLARFSLRLQPRLLEPAKSVAGFGLNLPINRCQSVHGKGTLRLGPDEWLLCGPPVEGDAIAGEIEASLRDVTHALVDVSHAYVALSVSGPGAAEAINSGCPLDLSSVAFPQGAATRTLVGTVEIILSRWQDRAGFEVACGRSFAAYVREFLEEVGQRGG